MKIQEDDEIKKDAIRLDIKMDECMFDQIGEIRDSPIGTLIVSKAYAERRLTDFNTEHAKTYQIPDVIKAETTSFRNFQRFVMHRYGIFQLSKVLFV